jgi:alkylhydroperoxidase family enzyme
MYDFLFGDRDPVAEPGTTTGTPGDWWTVFALVPDIFAHCVGGFRVYRNPARRLDPLLRELGQTRAGWLAASQFVFSQHCKSCRGLGMPEDKIAAIAHWQVADCFDAGERALLAYTDYLVDQHGRVPDAVFDALHEHFSDEEILEFTYITSLYFMHAVMTKALRLEWDDRPDPIVELPSPEGFDPVAFVRD